MLVFWITAALLAAAAATLVLRRAPDRADAGSSPELEAYRRHLADQDELKARGLLGDAEWRAARAEAGRRLLAVERAGPEFSSPDSRLDARIVLGSLVAAGAVAIGLYAAVGAPGAPDRPYTARLREWRSSDPGSLEPPALAAVFAQLARERPNDPERWSRLGLARAQANDAMGALRAFERAVALRPNDADDWTAIGVTLTELNDGEPGADGLRAFRRALEIDPTAPGPRFYLGQVEIAQGRTARGLQLWREAAAALPADDPRRRALEQDIRRVERGSGGTAADVAAAAPADQQAMIRGMVEGLAARLEDEPNDPQGWARLVRAYSVLGDRAAQGRALARARALFRDRPADLAAIEAAAR